MLYKTPSEVLSSSEIWRVGTELFAHLEVSRCLILDGVSRAPKSRWVAILKEERIDNLYR